MTCFVALYFVSHMHILDDFSFLGSRWVHVHLRDLLPAPHGLLRVLSGSHVLDSLHPRRHHARIRWGSVKIIGWRWGLRISGDGEDWESLGTMRTKDHWVLTDKLLEREIRSVWLLPLLVLASWQLPLIVPDGFTMTARKRAFLGHRFVKLQQLTRLLLSSSIPVDNLNVQETQTWGNTSQTITRAQQILAERTRDKNCSHCFPSQLLRSRVPDWLGASNQWLLGLIRRSVKSKD